VTDNSHDKASSTLEVSDDELDIPAFLRRQAN
jgi:cell division protein FtsZ